MRNIKFLMLYLKCKTFVPQMKTLNFHIFKKIVDQKRLWTLAAVNMSTKSFSTSTKTSDVKNILNSEDELMSWLPSPGKKAEDVIPEIITAIEAKPLFFKSVCDICEELRTLFPSAKISLFGSAGSNLALENSDVDINMVFKESKTVSRDLMFWVKKKLIKSNAFVSAQSIFARVPIIKCVHHTNISCDISFNSHLGTIDKSLISFILSIDSRIRPLILILKYLLKKEKFLFNTHCLVVMTVFFLQRLENPFIPSVCHLQNLAKNREEFNGWDVSFTRSRSHLSSVKNNLSVIELLEKFFQFYASFEFALEVISVFTAKSYLKPHFANTKLLPKEFHLYKKKAEQSDSFKFDCTRIMCIQGFFDHSMNISKNYIKEHVRDFQNFCRFNASIGQEVLKTNCSDKNKVLFLHNLFQEKAKPNQADGSSIIIPEAVLLLEKVDLDGAHFSADDLRKKWWTSIFDNLLIVMRDVMISDVVVTSNEPDGEYSDVMEEKVLSCVMPYSELASKKRKEVEKSVAFPKNISAIEKQKIITEELQKTLLKNLEKNSFQFDIKCKFVKYPTRVILKFEPKFNKSKLDGFLSNVCFYMQKNIPKWLL